MLNNQISECFIKHKNFPNSQRNSDCVTIYTEIIVNVCNAKAFEYLIDVQINTVNFMK